MKESLLMSAVVILFVAVMSPAQVKPKPSTVVPATPTVSAPNIRATPAFAEVLLRLTEIDAELDAMLEEYTEEFPKVRELRFESSVLKKEIERLSAVTDPFRLSAALGRMIVRKAELATQLFVVQSQFNDQHPDVKRAKKRVESYETAIISILNAK
jgi:hypothetical protein